jgi:SPP1 family predicted phage head-tail adaptor
MGLKAGDLRDRALVEDQTTTTNSSGDQVTEWEEVTFSARGDGKFWGALKPSSARELLTAESVKSEVKALFVMRYNANITAKMRLTIDGQIYNIAGIIRDPDTGMEWMTLPLSTGLNAG